MKHDLRLPLCCLSIVGCLGIDKHAMQAGAALSVDTPVHGWTILSENLDDDLAVIAAAHEFGINHLQLSHQVVMNLADIDPPRAQRINRLIDAAHAAGIPEVVVWDHIFVRLDHYPRSLRTGPNGTLDLDDPAFWTWLKADYRRMLDRLPHVNGVVLTFIETETRIEQQYSTRLRTGQEKIAAVVDAIAEVVIEERHLNLYARTFSYSHEEYTNIIGAVALMKNPHLRLMMKETPHDFFLTHPNDLFAGTIERPTLIEFDAANEYNGQGIIAGTWPQYILRRYSDLGHRPHVIGYVARTDRFGNTRIVGTPTEINLYALKRLADDPSVTAERIYDEFTTSRYGAGAASEVKAAFKNAYDIITSTLYTLGTNVSAHSSLNYDSEWPSFVRHVSGKWLAPAMVEIEHGVGQRLHYWRDVINHIAPPALKQALDASVMDKANPWFEVPLVRQSDWIASGEQMDEQYLKYIVTEKAYGVGLAQDSLQHIERARSALSPRAYEQLHELFERTLLTARLHHATASAYYGFRVWCRGDAYRTNYVRQTTSSGLDEIVEVARLIRDYRSRAPKGQWDWQADSDIAQQYFTWIVKGNWPSAPNGATNPCSGIAFPH